MVAENKPALDAHAQAQTSHTAAVKSKESEYEKLRAEHKEKEESLRKRSFKKVVHSHQRTVTAF